MRILLVHPNYHSGGAGITGNWPPAWVAYISGALKNAGFTDIRLIDAMTDHIDHAALEVLLRDETPDVVMCTGITSAMCNAQGTIRLVRKLHPRATTVLGGIHGTLMYGQVLSECPEIDYIVRGEGEEVVVNLVTALQQGRLPAERESIRGIAFVRDGEPFATTLHPLIQDLDSLTPDWDILNWDRYIYFPLNCRVAIPNFTRSFCSQEEFRRTHRTRDPGKFVDEIEYLVEQHHIGFFILADEAPTINRREFAELCEALVERNLGIMWGINTCVTDIIRDEALLPLYRRAGLVHVSLRTEASAHPKTDRCNNQMAVEQSGKAIQLLRDAGIVTEAKFIVGLENQTPATLEETYKLAQDWKPDLVNWSCYTPWPFSPEARSGDEVFAGVLENYRRFYSRKATRDYLWDKDPYRRRYLRGCFKAYLKSALERRTYENGATDAW